MSIAGAFLAKTADNFDIDRFLPEITRDSIESLLTISAASMLVIATFAVASMVSSYASAGSTATPRSFSLVIADDVSQNALSTFIGAFIFSIVALTALKNGFYDKPGRFALFALTIAVFAIVIVTFVGWVDRIARLGRLGTTIDKVEAAAAAALERRRRAPNLGGVSPGPRQDAGHAIYATAIGYVQRIDVPALQRCAEKSQARITVAALPGTFAAPGRPLAYLTRDPGVASEIDQDQLKRAFLIGDDRKFDEDPRFGLVVLSEIASRALSPAVNDPGTAIDIIGTLMRLFARWREPLEEGEKTTCACDRVEVPDLDLRDMFDDAFTGIARDGAGAIEVAVRLQKAFESLAYIGDQPLQQVAREHARLAFARAEKKLELPHDLEILRRVASFSA